MLVMRFDAIGRYAERVLDGRVRLDGTAVRVVYVERVGESSVLVRLRALKRDRIIG